MMFEPPRGCFEVKHTFEFGPFSPVTDFQTRCPNGKKTKLYKRAKLEKFAHYLMKDGLVTRLCVYSDRECTLNNSSELLRIS